MKTKVWLPLVALSLLAIVAIAVILFLSTQSGPPSLTQAPIPEVKALTWDELLESLVDKEGAEIRQHGVRFFQQGDPDKAFLLFKQASKKGDGWSSMVIGEMYDPATFAAEDFNAKRTAFSKANPRKALQWYDQAISQGERQAEERRNQLIERLRLAAAGGDSSAERLLQKVKQ